MKIFKKSLMSDVFSRNMKTQRSTRYCDICKEKTAHERVDDDFKCIGCRDEGRI